MSISAYVGLPGHGKSYGAVQNVIIPAIKQGRRVFTNIPCDEELFLKDFGLAPIQFETKDLQNNPNWFTEVFIAGSVLVFDECWRLWPSGLKANNVLEQHKTFLAEHRHFVGDDGYSTEIYLVTQDLSQLANFARALVENTYRMVKLLSVGLSKRFRVDIYEGPVTGPKPPSAKLITSQHGQVYSEKIYKYYKSHTKSQNGAGNESKVDQRGNAFGRFSFKLGCLFFLVAIPFIWFGGKSVKEGFSAGSSPQPVASPSAPVNGVPVTSQRPKPKLAFLSKAKSIFISHKIMIDHQTDIFLSVTFDDSRSSISLRQLASLGYVVSALNDCIFKVQGDDFNDYVMCNKPEEKQSFVQSIVTSPQSADI